MFKEKAETFDYLYDTDPDSQYKAPDADAFVQLGDGWRHSDIWQLRSVQDHNTDYNL